MHTRRSLLWVCALAAATLAPLASAQAQPAYPHKTIRLVVPNPAGGLPDTVARLFAQRLGERLGQPVVVDNKPGANGVVAAQAMASAPADGYTYLVTDGSMFSINPALYKNLSYDYQRDFLPVALAARAPLYLAAHPKVGVSSLQELVALAKARPGALTYGSSGVGSTHHLTMEALKSALGIDLRHIPYKGSSQSVPALIGGQVDVAFSALPSLAGFVKSGQVRLLGSNAAQRSPQEPTVPALAETIPGFDFAPTIGVFALRGTPAAVIERFSAEIALVARQPELVQTLNGAGIVAVGAGPAEFDQAMLGEISRLTQAVAAAGLKAE